MKTIAQSVLVVLLLLSAAPLALADEGGSSPSTSAPSSGPGDQFKAAGQNIGSAARQIGEGVKEGAVRTWDAVKAGADAAGQKLSGDGASTHSSGSDKDSAKESGR
jgi:hypothetical protein